MANPAQQWRMSAWEPVGANTVAAIIAAIKELIDDGVDYLGNAYPFPWSYLIENDGSDDVAIELFPSEPALQTIVILAGVPSGAPTPLMIPNDAFAVNMLLCGTMKNATALQIYDGWDANPPRQTSNFIGYGRSINLAANTATHVKVIVGREAICVIVRDSAGNTYPCIGGCPVDPFSTAAADAEANGRLYGMITPGNTAPNTNFHLSNVNTNGAWMRDGANNGVPKVAIFTPGAGTLIRPVPMKYDGANSPGATNLLSAGLTVFERAPFTYSRTSGGIWLGRLRDIYMVIDSLTGNVIRSLGGIDLAYLVGGRTGANANVMAFATGLAA